MKLKYLKAYIILFFTYYKPLRDKHELDWAKYRYPALIFIKTIEMIKFETINYWRIFY